MMAAVLDASALLALVLDEPGSEKVQSILTTCAMTTVNLGEVVGHFARIGSREGDIRQILDPCRSSAPRWRRNSRSSLA
jgi:ribonuclease VapC